MSDLLLHLLALLAYPGGLMVLAAGAVAETAAATALDGMGVRAAARLVLARLVTAGRRARPPVLAAALLAVLAATQLAAPFDPVAPPERNAVVAAVAIVAASWLGWSRGWAAPAVRLALLIQGCWLVAVLAPALVSETVRPQALGAVVVPAQLPLKAASGLLALTCLPAMLQLLPDAAPGRDEPGDEEAAAVRLLLWLPICGLVASLFLPPATDDPVGALRFTAGTFAVAAVAIGLAAVVGRRPRPGALAARLAAPLAAAVLAVAAVTAALT